MPVILLCVFFTAASPVAAQFGAAKELMSVVPKSAHVREEPDGDAEILWSVWKYMPVEVIAYRGDWRKIRDLDGDEGWMHKSDLGTTPTVMVSKADAKLRKTRQGKVVWILDRGYAVRVFGIRGDWLEVSDLDEASGWIHQSLVWGFTTTKSLERK